MSIHRTLIRNLPAHLLETPLGQSLLKTEDDEDENEDKWIEIPDAVYLRLLNVDLWRIVDDSRFFRVDFEHLLQSIRFWGLTETFTNYVFDVVLSYRKRFHPAWFPSWHVHFAELHDLLRQILFLRSAPAPCGKYFLSSAAEQGHFQLMQWARKRFYSTFSHMTIWHILKSGRIDCIQWAHEQGMSLSSACRTAAHFGHLHCLQWAHEHGAPLTDSDVCRYAAENGHLDCLQYAHEHGCPWDKYTILNAMKHGHMDCLEYAITHGCPIPP